MLDFSLSDEQRMIRDMAHDFAEKAILPVAEHYDQADVFVRQQAPASECARNRRSKRARGAQWKSATKSRTRFDSRGKDRRGWLSYWRRAMARARAGSCSMPPVVNRGTSSPG
jgi:alkylation response protein AidB-like acyl-CoA dehydrogenase